MRRKRRQIVTQPGYVIYLRTSTEEVQAPQRSQDGQRRDVERKLKFYEGIPFMHEYIDNYTGTSSDRRSYQEMLKQAHKGAFSHIFAATPDRFGREDVEALRAIDELTAMGIHVRFAAYPDLDPAHEDDRLYLNILFGMARRESAVIPGSVESFFTQLEDLLTISGSMGVIGMIGLAIMYLGSSWPLISDWKRDNPRMATQVTIGLLLLVFVGGGGLATLGITTG